VVVTATERRSQHENRHRAVVRLRKAIAVRIRRPAATGTAPEGALAEVLCDPAWPRVSQKSAAYLVAAARTLDCLESAEGKVSDVAARLGATTASLVKFLSLDADLWEEAGHIRRRFGRGPLRQ
jgi:hypothetical protein